jgi:PAS domain S-box-containing protein
MPHVYCLREPALIALHAVSDTLIAASYFVIPAVVLTVISRRKRDLEFHWAYVLFGIFILACGATHVLGVVTLWRPVYRLEGVIKAITALASVATAVALVKLMPQAARLPGPATRRQEMEEKRRAGEYVTRLNAELEIREKQRTLELEAANAHLAEFTTTLDKAQIIIQRLDGAILFWNSGAESLYGWSREEALGRKSHELLETNLPVSFEEIQRELLEHGSWTGEFRQRCRDGSIIWVASYWVLHRDNAGNAVSVVKVNNDITVLKQTDEALRASEATARSLFENASQGILTADIHGHIVDSNAMAERLFGYTRSELISMSVDMLLPESLCYRHATHRARFALHPRARPMGQGMDLIARRKDGSEFPVEISLGYLEQKGGGLTIAFISDITARIQASQEREGLIARLEGALSEKTVLLKEVHHRVKNNMAVIAGLLGMQAETLDDERAAVALAESQRRVLSMALIHEYLYANENLDRVNFGTYVEQLSSELSASYAIAADLVTVSIEAQEVDLSVHSAIPCGLILNELLSNAIKYGFPDGRSGEITVRFSRVGPGEFLLSCADNGMGIPESFDWKNPKSLGLRIVRILAKQIDGDLQLHRDQPGTRFELRFPAA